MSLQALLKPKTKPAGLDAITAFYSRPEQADYLGDPALLQIEAADQTSVRNAEADALRQREQTLLNLGDPGLARTVLGAADPTLGGVSADPDTSTSLLARLARTHRDTVNQHEAAFNKDNLWYSSARAKGLADDAADYTTGQADTIATAQQQLDQISAGVASARGAASDADRKALADAYSRYLQAATSNPPNALPGPGAGTDGYGAVQPGQPVDAAGNTAPANIGDFPHLNPSSHEVFQPVRTGASLSFEPKPTGAGYAQVSGPAKPKPLQAFLGAGAQARRNSY